jgi:hypothetical protein
MMEQVRGKKWEAESMPEKYDLTKMLEEIEEDTEATAKKGGSVSQDEIKKIIQGRQRERKGTEG